MDIHAYIRHVRTIPKLSKEEELALARRIRSEPSDEESVTKLVTANLYLTCQIALSLRKPSVDLGDLIQEGNLALFEAVWAYDPSRNCKFCTFVAHRIRSRLYAYLNKKQLDDAEVVAIAFDRYVDDDKEELLEKALSKLTPQEQQILRLYFCGEYKLTSIGVLLRMSAERVRQLQVVALAKVKRYFGRRNS